MEPDLARGAATRGAAWRQHKSKLHSFKVQELSNMAWALATLDYHDHAAFMGALLEEAKPKLLGFTIAAVTQMSFALTKLNIKDADFTRALQARRALLVSGK
ncbi:hypothetical protein FOA52_015128 [Chlamydomonas sp. UWO 241]|nr:hypothetical protein FOA52_015128 [Chlamydomonas sp. UWO 241]